MAQALTRTFERRIHSGSGREGVVTFAQIKFAPQSAEGNPVARIVLNVESQLNG